MDNKFIEYTFLIAGTLIVVLLISRILKNRNISKKSNNNVILDDPANFTFLNDYEYTRVVWSNNITGEDNSSNTDKEIRKFIDIGMTNEANLEKAKLIIQNETLKHPLFIDNRTETEKNNGEPAIPIKIVTFGDFSFTLRAYIWAKNIDASIVLEREVLRNISLAFDENGIEIPFLYRTILFTNNSDY